MSAEDTTESGPAMAPQDSGAAMARHLDLAREAALGGSFGSYGHGDCGPVGV
jgi:hypothetical protein